MSDFVWGLVLGVHILGVTVWVGGMAFMVLALRPGLVSIEPSARLALLRAVLKKFFFVVWHAMPIVLLTGYALLFGVYGGFKGAMWNVHVMHLLGLIMAAIFVAIVFGPWATMRAEATPPAQAVAAMARIRPLVLVNLVLGAATIVIAALT